MSMQLHTSKQLAYLIVLTHPRVPCEFHLFEELAKQAQLEHLAGWEEIIGYLQTITLENLHLYVRLYTH